MNESGWSPNPITHVFPLGIGAYGWQVHGIWVGVALAGAYLVVVIANNVRIMNSQPKPGDDGVAPFRRLHRWKWILFAVFMVGIGLSSAEFHTVGG